MNAFAGKLQPPYKMNSPNSQSISIIPGDIDNPKDRVRWSTTQLLLDRTAWFGPGPLEKSTVWTKFYATYEWKLQV